MPVQNQNATEPKKDGRKPDKNPMKARQSRKEKEARMQRLLAREQGQAPAEESNFGQGRTQARPQNTQARPQNTQARPQNTQTLDFSASRQMAEKAPRTQKISPMMQKRRRRRRNLILAMVAIAAIAFAMMTGLLSSSLAALGDVTDSVLLYFERDGGWPASTGIVDPLRIEELAGGFVELGAEDVTVFSAYGSKVRSFQPGYAKPALAVGNTRFCVYNRSGTELRVESRTKNLYTKSFLDGILLCSMSNNGNLAVVTQSNRYTAEVTVYDTSFTQKYTWCPTQEMGTPIVLRFASDNHRFAAGCLSAKNGQLCSTIYLMDTGTEKVTASYTATEGSTVLEMKWISPTRLLVVFDTYAAILNPSNGQESARYDYGGATLQSVATGGRDTALLTAGRAGSTLTMLDDSLTILAQVSAGQASTVSSSRTNVYLLGGTSVRCYGYDGVLKAQQSTDTAPLAVLDAKETLLFIGNSVRVLDAAPVASPKST